MKLAGRLALVTGASRGVGAAVALVLAQQGADVAVNYLQQEAAAQRVVESIRRLGRRSGTYRADVADQGQVEAMVQDIGRELGEVDILVNNAGVHRGGRIHRVAPEEFALVVDTAIKGAFYCSRLVVPGMVQRGWGRIVNVTSVMGLMGWPGDTAYASAKAGVVGFTKSLARDVAETGVLVNAVAAGYIATDMTSALTERARQMMLDAIPLKRPGTPEEVAEAVAFLVTGGTYMTGAVLLVDGGMAM